MEINASRNKELLEMKYATAVQTIKEAIQRSQARALHVVNSEVLSLNYGIGRYISENSRKDFWGTGALAQISSQLQKEMPGLKGYSETSLKDMRTFYEEWAPLVNRQPVADELPSNSGQMPVAAASMIDESLMLREIRQPMADELDWGDFLRVPFTHHVMILFLCEIKKSHLRGIQWSHRNHGTHRKD